jgi:glutaminase
VSTGRLPVPDRVRTFLYAAHERFRAADEGANADVYPALATVPSDLFGICVAAADGAIYAVGDADYSFSIMSVSKPFVFALVCQALGPEVVRARVGVNSTGLPFNSAAAVERDPDGRTNPMVNAGAIATTSLVPGRSPAEKWRFIHEGLSSFAGRVLSTNQEVLESALATNSRNQALARMLESMGRIYGDPAQSTELYTKQCALDVSALDLAVMGATLAAAGVERQTKLRVVDAGE